MYKENDRYFGIQQGFGVVYDSPDPDSLMNPSKKETPHSFKGQQLEDKSFWNLHEFFREIS